ncbi:Hypothetical protein A7982_06613 [Minicystis rosea]|nr:Hypothetical protein A7982_06613 [Minicystis rosea]
MLIILNIAAGANNMSSIEISQLMREECTVYNLDINPSFPNNDRAVLPYHQPAKAIALLSMPNIEYANATEQLDFEDRSVDVIVSVSPYGFPLINPETKRVLKRGGHIIVAGSQRNKFVAKDSSLFQSGFDRTWLEEIARDQSLVSMKLFFFIENYYKSQTSHGEHATKIDVLRAFRKLV